MSKIVVIVGPTGTGKTKASIEIAKMLNAKIINADTAVLYPMFLKSSCTFFIVLC